VTLAGLAALALLAAWAWIVGGALVTSRSAAERIAMGLMAALGLAWLAMLAGAFGVGLLGSFWAPLALALLALAVALARRRPSAVARPALPPVAVGVVASLLAAAPLARWRIDQLWPSHGDMLWHSGWIHQLQAGVSAPGGVYPGEPNGYPWLFHAFAAWIAQILPGGVSDALAVVEVVGLAAAGVGVWLVARELGAGERAGTWSVGLFIAAAGVGWIWQHGPAALFRMNGANLGPFHGDLVLSNAMTPALGNLPPLVPRELGLAYAPIALWLVLRARGGGARGWWTAGAAIGLVALVAPLAGLFCAGWAALLALVERSWAAWRALAAAAAVAAVWLVPLALGYHRYHGFVSITIKHAVEPSLGQVLVALGVVLPLGLAGLAVIRRRDPAAFQRPLVVAALPLLAVVPVALLTSQASLLGTPALERWLRYLPYLELGLAVPAGVCADAAVSAAGRRMRPAAVAVAVVLAAAAAGSTALASAAVWRTPYPFPLVCTSLPIAAGDRVAVIAREPLSDYLALELFGRTGAGFWYLDPRRAKVRFATWPAGLDPPLRARHQAVLDYGRKDGRRPPGVDVLVVRQGWAVDAAGLRRVASCSYRGLRWRVLRGR
jgi:hypothetical protein